MKIQQWLFKILKKQNVTDGRTHTRTHTHTHARTHGQRENSIPHHKQSLRGYKNAKVWVVWVKSRGVGLWVPSKAGPRRNWFIIYHKVWHVLIEPKVYTTSCRTFFIFALAWREKSTKTEHYICHEMFCIVHHTLVRWCTNVALERRKFSTRLLGDGCFNNWVTDVSIIL